MGTYTGEPIFFDLDDVFFYDFDEVNVKYARENLKVLTRSPQWKQFTNEVAKEIGLPSFHKCIKLQRRNDIDLKELGDFDEEYVKDARENLKVLTGSPQFTNKVAKEIELPSFHKCSELQARNVFFPFKLF